MTVVGPTKAIINGTLGDWDYDENELDVNEPVEFYWDKTESKFLLGDFNSLVSFLVVNSGKKENIESVANGQ